jgi:hypothetical protein
VRSLLLFRRLRREARAAQEESQEPDEANAML